jgi:hypothetical protein
MYRDGHVGPKYKIKAYTIEREILEWDRYTSQRACLQKKHLSKERS